MTGGLKALASLDAEELAAVVARLKERGWDQKAIMRDRVFRSLPKEDPKPKPEE